MGKEGGKEGYKRIKLVEMGKYEKRGGVGEE